jgi:hypothetical protein
MTARLCFVLAFFASAAPAQADPPDVAGIVKQVQAKRGKVVLDGKGLPVEAYLYNKAFGDADLALFKPFPGLKVLSLQHARINDASVERIVAAHPNLEVINIHDTQVTPACVKYLARLKALRTLENFNDHVTDDLIRALRAHNLLHLWRQANSGTAARPTSPADVIGLSLEMTRITPDGLKEFADFKGVRYICYLRIDDATLHTLGKMRLLHAYWLADEAARMDARPRSAAEVKSFGLTRPNGVTHEGLKELAAFTYLQSLSLVDFHVTPEALKEVANLKSLEQLWLGPSTSDAGLKELAALPRLHTLILQGSGVTDAGLKEISRIKSLRHLYVEGTRISSAGLGHLAGLPLTTLKVSLGILNDEALDFLRQAKLLHVLANAKGKSVRPTSLEDIHYLVLARAPITDASIKHLVAMKALWGINLRGTRVSDQGVAELKKALPNLHITR